MQKYRRPRLLSLREETRATILGSWKVFFVLAYLPDFTSLGLAAVTAMGFDSHTFRFSGIIVLRLVARSKTLRTHPDCPKP